VETTTETKKILTADDFKPRSYVSLKIGETATLVIKEIAEVKVSPDFALSGKDFRYEITAMDDKVLSVSSWKLWIAIRDALKGKEIKNSILEIKHTGTGEYTARLL